ncbi:hypothetical protein EC973_003394 [Apophysomyces ossiformis]|uniref:C2H2-type domain-containing protein n=1 Tax=Apophysomyces ossiformis TaxID=679940 RepID=A0A8H7BQP6_9FUNG|nr:hypothetical protein EC973_003394 [Apophysomyces ossiformis]
MAHAELHNCTVPQMAQQPSHLKELVDKLALDVVQLDDNLAMVQKELLRSPLTGWQELQDSGSDASDTAVGLVDPLPGFKSQAVDAFPPSPSDSFRTMTESMAADPAVQNEKMISPAHTPASTSPSFPAECTPVLPQLVYQTVETDTITPSSVSLFDNSLGITATLAQLDQGTSTLTNNALPQDPSHYKRYCFQCNRSFGRHQELLRHFKSTRSHSAGRKFTCPICHHDFTRKDVLLRHSKRCVNNINKSHA